MEQSKKSDLSLPLIGTKIYKPVTLNLKTVHGMKGLNFTIHPLQYQQLSHGLVFRGRSCGTFSPSGLTTETDKGFVCFSPQPQNIDRVICFEITAHKPSGRSVEVKPIDGTPEELVSLYHTTYERITKTKVGRIKVIDESVETTTTEAEDVKPSDREDI